jgi:GNAT superfamily N-acetyltransferase
MDPTTFRHARRADLSQIPSVFATAIDDLDKKHGFFKGATPTSPPNPQYGYWLEKDPASFWVAEDRQGIVGYSFSFVRGSLWFLADLFILPTHQGKGIGRALIQRTLGSWKGHKIANRALITPAFNRASVSLYMRFGMLPRQPLYFASAPRKSVAQSLQRIPLGSLEVEQIAHPADVSARLEQIHKAALGFPQGWHNEYFSKVQRARCFLFKRRGRPEGYAFLRPNGRIGPLVVKSESSFRPALHEILRLAGAGESNEVTMLFAGTNEEAALASVRHGFRITYPLLFLSSRPMGDWGNYLFYSPGLM